jgi:hypothetical protein
MSRFSGMRKSYATASKLINPMMWLGFRPSNYFAMQCLRAKC